MEDTSKKVSNKTTDDLLKGNEYLNEMPSPEDLDSRWLRWKCLVCGYLYEGVVRLKVCPKCGNEDPDKFEDAE
jgi:rubrerythrin